MSSLFGKWVTVNQKLGRRRKTPSRLERERGSFEFKTWEPFKISPRRVLIIGRRTLQNGETRFADGGDSIVWYKNGSGVPAYLVVENDLFRPFYVPRDAIVEILDNANP